MPYLRINTVGRRGSVVCFFLSFRGFVHYLSYDRYSRTDRRRNKTLAALLPGAPRCVCFLYWVSIKTERQLCEISPNTVNNDCDSRFRCFRSCVLYDGALRTCLVQCSTYSSSYCCVYTRMWGFCARLALPVYC